MTNKKKIIEQIIAELREFKKKTPDIDYYNIIGYLAGMKMRPNKKSKTIK